MKSSHAELGLKGGPQPDGSYLLVEDEPFYGFAKGDLPGHEFHGNQWTGGAGGIKPDAQGRYHVGKNLTLAVRLIGEGKDVVLEQPRQLSTLMDRLAAIGQKAAAGEKKVYDLCHVSVPGTNLFCSGNKGIARVDMPQFTGKPQPGSKGDSLPKDAKGEVNIGPAFGEHMHELGGSVKEDTEDAAYLRASQRELDGVKIAGMMKAMQEGKVPESPIWVSKDNYIIDGHHRWAAKAALEYASGKPVMMPIHRVSSDIVTVLYEANKFAHEWGVGGRAVGKGDVQGHEFHGNQWGPGHGRLAHDEGLVNRLIASTQDEHGNLKPDAGFTIDARTREDVKNGFSVGVFPSRSLELDAASMSRPAMKAALQKWLDDNEAKLQDPRVKIGGWVDPSNNHIWLDVSRVYRQDEKDIAIAMGTRMNQKAIANLGAISSGNWGEAFINTGGTGAAVKAAMMGKAVLVFFDGDATAEQILDALLSKIHKSDVDDGAHDAALSPLNPMDKPSRAQLKAGNFRLGHINVGGLYISIENPVGSHRGNYGQPLAGHYGYVRTTEGADGEHVDVFVKPGTQSTYDGPVFVIDQYVDGKWDEHKAMLGWSDEASARAAYLASYQPGWDGLRAISRLSMDQFKTWLLQGNTKVPFSKLC
jgi:hypothetical protein